MLSDAMRRALALAMVAMAGAFACADPPPPVSGDLPGDRGSLEGPITDAAADARPSSPEPDADAAADADAETLGDGG
jgi:hypothetical protein